MPVPLEEYVKIRNALWDNPQWIDQYLKADDNFVKNQEERATLESWRHHFIADTFFVVKQLAKYSVLISGQSPARLFGVTGLSSSLKDRIFTPIPFTTKMVLLPFKDKIIFDGFFEASPIHFGPGIRSSLNRQYKTLKQTTGILERLSNGQYVAKAPKKPTKKSAQALTGSAPLSAPKNQAVFGDEKVPAPMVARYNEIAQIVAKFGGAYFSEDLTLLCVKAAAKLARKRPSPLQSGYSDTWAAGICHAVGSINFIFDRSKPTYVPVDSFARFFGLAKSTITGKSREVKKLLNLSYFTHEFTIENIFGRLGHFFIF